MQNYSVFEQHDGMLIYRQKITAKSAEDALRIAKQKGFHLPIIGEARD